MNTMLSIYLFLDSLLHKTFSEPFFLHRQGISFYILLHVKVKHIAAEFLEAQHHETVLALVVGCVIFGAMNVLQVYVILAARAVKYHYVSHRKTPHRVISPMRRFSEEVGLPNSERVRDVVEGIISLMFAY